MTRISEILAEAVALRDAAECRALALELLDAAARLEEAALPRYFMTNTQWVRSPAVTKQTHEYVRWPFGDVRSQFPFIRRRLKYPRVGLGAFSEAMMTKWISVLQEQLNSTEAQLYGFINKQSWGDGEGLLAEDGWAVKDSVTVVKRYQ